MPFFSSGGRALYPVAMFLMPSPYAIAAALYGEGFREEEHTAIHDGYLWVLLSGRSVCVADLNYERGRPMAFLSPAHLKWRNRLRDELGPEYPEYR